VLAWLLAVPVLFFVVLRDPDIDYTHVLSTDLPLALLFAAGGGAIVWVVSEPSRTVAARAVGGLLVVAVILIFVLTFFGLAPPMLQKVRLSTLLLGVYLMAVPTFTGDRSARLRLVVVWIGFMALFHYLATLINSPSTVDVPGEFLLGGYSLTLLVASSVMILSFPVGVLLALARTSKMPIFRILATVFIEVVRGVPLITVLFFFSVMIQLFLPDGMSIIEVMAVILGYSLFSAAYLAENVRGGLQSVRRGQYEAAQALGMSTVQTTTFIVLPQALRAVIPPLVGQTIATYKETSLIAIVGLTDLLLLANIIVPANREFVGSKQLNLFFAAAIFWTFSFALSRASLRLEEKLGVGTR
jgi:general L-amino acid transport system permease protein